MNPPPSPDDRQETGQPEARPLTTPDSPSRATMPYEEDATGADLSRPAPAAPAPLPSIPGYELLDVLGRGGMGIVYKARHLKLNRLVALKTLLAGGHADAEQLNRFQTEARSVARLQHPNVVAIYDIGEHQAQPFVALEYVDGESLARRLNGKAMAGRDAAALLEPLAQALHYCHSHNVLHRDLKPANVLLTSTGIPKLGDFGLAKQLDDDSGQTRSGAVFGTPSYMAPEQADGRIHDVGPATDVYALGAILYECLTGRPPFRGANVSDTLRQVLTQEPAPPSKLNPRIHRDLETICLKALAKEPARRYATAEALAEDLGRFLGGEAILARRDSLPVKLLRRARRHSVLIGLSLLVLIAAPLTTWLVLRSRGDFRATALVQDFETVLDSKAWTPDDLARAEGLLTQIEQVAPERTTATRQRLHQRQIDFVRAAIARPRLPPEDLPRLEETLQWLAARQDAEEPSLRQELTRRLRFWEQVLDLRPPFDGLAGIVDPADVTVGPTGLTRRGSTPAVLTRVPSPGAVRIEATFGGAWAKAPAFGVLFDAAESHSQDVTALAISPDARYAATAAGNAKAAGEVVIWDLVRGRESARYRRDTPAGWSVAFTADGLLAVVNDRETTVRLLDPTSGAVKKEFPTRQKFGLLSIAASADGKRLAVGGGEWGKSGQVELLRLPGGEHEAMLTGHPRIVQQLAWTADSRTLLVANRNDGEEVIVKLWDVEARREFLTWKHPQRGGALALSPDGQTLAWTADGKARTRNLRSGADTAVPARYAIALAFAADGQLLITEGSRELRPVVTIWSPGQIAPRTTCRGATLPMPLLTGAGGVVVAVDQERIVRAWDAATGQARFAMGPQRYSFLVRPEPPDAIRPSDARSTAVRIQISRNQTILREERAILPAGSVRIKAERARTEGGQSAERDGDVLSIEVNDLAALRYQELFAPRRTNPGVFALHLPDGVELTEAKAWRQALPARTSPLEEGDDRYYRGDFEGALTAYRAAAGGPAGLEARYKQALCLAALGRSDEAVEAFGAVHNESGPRWPALAGCQLWLHYLRLQRFADADEMLDRLAARFKFDDLVAQVPEDLRTQIYTVYINMTRGLNLLKPDPNRIRNAERAVTVARLLKVDEVWMADWYLCRTYHAAGRLDDAYRIMDGHIRAGNPESPHGPGMFLVEYCWIRRLRGDAAGALAEMDRWMFGPGGVVRPRCEGWATERARLLCALNRHADAEAALAPLFRWAQPQPDSPSIRSLVAPARLLEGLLRQRRGDEAGSRESWKQGWSAARFDLYFGSEFLGGLIDGSLSGDMTDAEAEAIVHRLIESFGEYGKFMELAGVVRPAAAALRSMWTSPRGRKLAEQIGYGTIPISEMIHQLPRLWVFETLRLGAGPPSMTAEQEERFWESADGVMTRFLDGKIQLPQLLLLAGAWKGRSDVLGWGGVARALDPGLRGPLGYTFGLRCLRLNPPRPVDARAIFQSVLKDAAADSPLAKLLKEELERLPKQ